MKFIPANVDYTFDTDNGRFNTLVVEEQNALRNIITDIVSQLQGLDGDGIISVGEEFVSMAKNALLLDVFIPFDLNRKTLINKIVSALEKRASAPECFEKSAAILRDTELWLDSLAFEFPCDISFSGVSVSALIKACAPEIRGSSDTLAGNVLDYIELIYEFDRPRLIITLNMRSFVTDADMNAFARDCVSHGYHVLAIESSVHPLLENENRVILDSDLCLIF